MKIKRGYYINDHSGKECFVKYTYFFTVAYEYPEDGDNAHPHYTHFKTFARNWSPSVYYVYANDSKESGV